MPELVRIATGTPESAAYVADVERAMRITSAINALTYADVDAVRDLFGELIEQPPGDHLRVVPPFYSDHGKNITVGNRVFINQRCTIYDLAPVTIGDDVLIGPNASLITSGHPVPAAQRRELLIGRPIVIGENSVVAAGSVVTRDVPANTLVGGNPAHHIRPTNDD